MSRRRKKEARASTVQAKEAEEIDLKFKTEVLQICQKVLNGISDRYTFPSTLSSDQRKFIHKRCLELGLKSRSSGKEPDRMVTVSIKDRMFSKTYYLKYNEKIHKIIDDSLQNYKIERPANSFYDSQRHVRNPISSSIHELSNDPVMVGSIKYNNFNEFRENLPVFQHREEFLEIMRNHDVVIVTSETGSGKTTQIPQYILENAYSTNSSCKIICCEPRRLAAVTVARRVAAERGEEVGQTVGYRIKLDSITSLETALIYCTNGVILRQLMHQKEKALQNITHIIVDEIHEREASIDYLLLLLKTYCLSGLKIILMSATMNIDLFRNYFDNPGVLNIPGKLFNIDMYHMDQIIGMLNNDQICIPNVRDANFLSNTASNFLSTVEDGQILIAMDEAIIECVKEGSEDSFSQLMMLILSEGGNFNHQASVGGYTPLVAAVIHGKIEIIEELLGLGAEVSMMVLQYAKTEEVLNLLRTYKRVHITNNYTLTTCNEPVNHDLIVKIIRFIQNHYDDKGSILIFLPGYDDIQNCHEKILDSTLINHNDFEIFMLHSCMDMKTQHSVFNISLKKQKIILSTNIAETSITIPDVSFVIDSGLVKEKHYNIVSGACSLQTIYISKASAKQRAGRAGRTKDGVCFRLYTEEHYQYMSVYSTPEILRKPLHELCLQTRLLLPRSIKIAEFLSGAIEPPPETSIYSAIAGLIELGAFEKNEDLTHLGKHLVNLPVEPRLAKMLVYGVLFKCLDPILTLVACMESKDLFFLPQKMSERDLARKQQEELAEGTLSDHFILFNAYQKWQIAKSTNNHRSIRENFINSSNLETICQSREYLLSHLRALGFVSTQKRSDINDVNENSQCWPIVKAVLLLGCYPNLAFAQQKEFVTKTEKKVNFQRYSAVTSFNTTKDFLDKSENYCVMFDEINKFGNRSVIKCATVVTPMTVALLCGEDRIIGENCINIDCLSFQHSYSDSLATFCVALNTIITKKIAHYSYQLSNTEKNIMKALCNVLREEEENHRLLVQPTGLGDVPIFFKVASFGKGVRDKRHKESRSNDRHFGPSHVQPNRHSLSISTQSSRTCYNFENCNVNPNDYTGSQLLQNGTNSVYPSQNLYNSGSRPQDRHPIERINFPNTVWNTQSNTNLPFKNNLQNIPSSPNSWRNRENQASTSSSNNRRRISQVNEIINAQEYQQRPNKQYYSDSSRQSQNRLVNGLCTAQNMLLSAINNPSAQNQMKNIAQHTAFILIKSFNRDWISQSYLPLSLLPKDAFSDCQKNQQIMLFFLEKSKFQGMAKVKTISNQVVHLEWLSTSTVSYYTLAPRERAIIDSIVNGNTLGSQLGLKLCSLFQEH